MSVGKVRHQVLRGLSNQKKKKTPQFPKCGCGNVFNLPYCKPSQRLDGDSMEQDSSLEFNGLALTEDRWDLGASTKGQARPLDMKSGGSGWWVEF